MSRCVGLRIAVLLAADRAGVEHVSAVLAVGIHLLRGVFVPRGVGDVVVMLLSAAVAYELSVSVRGAGGLNNGLCVVVPQGFNSIRGVLIAASASVNGVARFDASGRDRFGCVCMLMSFGRAFRGGACRHT